MNYLNLIKNTLLTRSGSTDIQTWLDIDSSDPLHGRILLELNNSLRDIWLDNTSIFEDRSIILTCVISQNNYDMPCSGIIKQDGLLLQPLDSNNSSSGQKNILEYNLDYTKFFQGNDIVPQLGQPKEFCMFGNQIYFYPYPDKVYPITCLYESTNWALSVTTVNIVSYLGQKVLNVASTNEFSVGDVVYINRYKSNEETGVISSIQPGISLTFIGNLTFDHQINERVTKEKQSLDYENDEPNWGSEYHQILIYHTLEKLMYNDPARQMIYSKACGSMLGSMINRLSGSQDEGNRTIIAYCGW